MELKKELPILTIVMLKLIYLGYIWNELPRKVPMHWNINGEIDRYGDKSELIIIPLLLPLLVYLIFLVISKIDPKNKLKNMGGKLQTIKFFLTTIMSILAIFILYSAKKQSFPNPNYIILLIGVLFIILGNYFKTIKPNYFIGIRTPWTLENDSNWKKTHNFGGKLWFIGGVLVVVFSLILNKNLNFKIFMIITGLIAIIPIGYSYMIFKKEKERHK